MLPVGYIPSTTNLHSGARSRPQLSVPNTQHAEKKNHLWTYRVAFTVFVDFWYTGADGVLVLVGLWYFGFHSGAAADVVAGSGGGVVVQRHLSSGKMHKVGGRQ